MPLRKADLTATRRFEDGDAYLILRTGGLTKSEADRLRDTTAAMKIDAAVFAGVADPREAAKIEIDQRTAQANRILFELLVVEWSLDAPLSGESYGDLDEESGRWVDQCIEEVLRERRERAEGNASSSKKRRPRASSSDRAAS